MSRSLLVDSRLPTGASQDDPLWRRLLEIIRVINAGRLVFGRVIDAEDSKPEGSGLVFVSGTPRLIPHKLGRKASGFVEVSGVELADGHLGLKPAAFPKGATSEHFVSVVAATSGRTHILVF